MAQRFLPNEGTSPKSRCSINDRQKRTARNKNSNRASKCAPFAVFLREEQLALFAQECLSLRQLLIRDLALLRQRIRRLSQPQEIKNEKHNRQSCEWESTHGYCKEPQRDGKAGTNAKQRRKSKEEEHKVITSCVFFSSSRLRLNSSSAFFRIASKSAHGNQSKR